MKVFRKVIIGAAIRAFTKKNGALVPTTTPEGVWDLEATLAWFLRGLLLVFLLWIAGQLGVDAEILMQHVSVH
jgi:hypothetical protein